MSLFQLAAGFTRTSKVIAVADVVESVRLMEQDEQEFIARWRRFVNFVQERLPLAPGRLHRSLGDGLMLEFSDPQGCVRTALEMQAWFHEGNKGLPAEEQVHLRIGAHVADFVADKHDIYGADVNLAARIASLAGPGEIVISAALRERLGRKLALPVEDLGPCHLKHLKKPVHAWRIGRAGGAPVIHLPAAEGRTLRATVAVLPFGTEGTGVDGVSAETLTDEVVAALARSDALQVVSRMSTAAVDARLDTLDAVRTQASARYVLTGRGRVHGDDLSLFAELADATSGHVVWADSFRGAARTGMVDTRLLAQVVLAVHAAVFRQEVERAQALPLPSLEGSTLLAASIGLMHRLSPVDMDRARLMLDHLCERWRRQAPAHAWLAHLHLLRAQQACAGVSGPDQAMARAHAAAAVQYDPGSPLVLAVDAHACVHGARNLESAEDRIAQALSLRADHSLALLFQAELQAMRGEAKAGRATAHRAAQTASLEPLRFLYDSVSALAAWADGDPEASIAFARRALQHNPRYMPAWHTLVAAQVEGERLGEARATQQRVLRRQPAFSAASFLAATPICDELAGRFADALLQAGAPAG